MEVLKDVVLEWALWIDVIALVLIALTRFFSNTKSSWAGVGCILIVIALGNAISLVSVGINPTEHIASLFGLAVLGSLGVRLFSNWLTDGAT
ncbi:MULTISPECIES: hypothetical protein [Pseudoalteromonas]|uniref:Uncharacterized protein n=1 Tax=Pseudoalteromonas tetraodonis GFC TaxID=1315271 RepID=A0AA37S4P6_9GAMM|nr:MULTISPECIES: hypothetical protein [Pseudoalteromonas]ADT68438.1 hypothetical protein PSM_A1506 [Pseudoalteromonas sp. SM9913]ATD03156.1 hypothetical protein PTET_a1750 [Pseudoalteromonas tetraodonis]MDN3411058.1 hypothetical protein [Pseudoalteromonas sp. APC 3250]TMP51376.1 hypothetical protein CWB81_06225 [Pseudoalteromonas sp. S1688]GEN37063.1 hypothetical protein PTE01_01730 [Pseudoalteromonas tetraodonis GFC]